MRPVLRRVDPSARWAVQRYPAFGFSSRPGDPHIDRSGDYHARLWRTSLFDTGIGISVRDLTMAAISGGFALGVGLPLFNLGHRSVVAARIPLLLMTEVVLAPLWVWIWPGETPGVTTLIGGAVIMSAVAWLMLRARASELPRPVVAAT